MWSMYRKLGYYGRNGRKILCFVDKIHLRLLVPPTYMYSDHISWNTNRSKYVFSFILCKCDKLR